MQLVQMTEEDILEDDKQRARNTLRIFMNSDDPYYQTVYDGSGTVEGTEVNWVAIVDKAGNVICRLGFSTINNELICKKFSSDDGSVEEIYSNFTEIEGVKVPMKSVRNVNSQKMMTYDLSEYIINGEIPANAFSKPE